MRHPFFTGTFLLFITITCNSCNGQVKTNDTQIANDHPKLIKNHFIPDLAEEFMFVQSGLQDRLGNMWFGTAGNGIYVYDGTSFVNFTHKSFINFSLKEDLNHNDILSCLEDKSGNIWFGTRRGLIRYKPGEGKPEAKDFNLYLIPQNTINSSTGKRSPYVFQTGDNFVWSIMQDKSGKIWFGTSKGIYIHDPTKDFDKDEPLFRYFLDNDSLINNNNLKLMDISAMLQDRDGNIWLSSAWTKGEGIVVYNGKSLTNFTPDSINSFRSIIEKKNGDLLFLSPTHGIYEYNGKSFSNLNEKIGINGEMLICFLEDENENLWIAHNNGNMQNEGDGGLWRFDGISTEIFTTKNGLNHNHVYTIVKDRNGNIWFGTRNTGLCKYDGKTFTDFTE